VDEDDDNLVPKVYTLVRHAEELFDPAEQSFKIIASLRMLFGL